MSRVESIPTWKILGVSKTSWLFHLASTGKIKTMVAFYTDGIVLIDAANRDMLGTHSYSEIVGTDKEELLKQRNKVKEFYQIRLKELEGKTTNQS